MGNEGTEEMCHNRQENGILLCAEDADVTMSPALFLTWEVDIMVQIMWTSTGETEFVPLQESI